METPQLRQVLGLIEQLPQSGEPLRQRTWAVLEAARSLDVEALAVVERKLCELVATAASPERSSTLAVAVGALIEGGASPHELSRSLLVAFKRWLPGAGRFAVASAELEEFAHDAHDSVQLGDRTLSRTAVDGLARADGEGFAAYQALDSWWRAAVPAWSRAPLNIPTARRELADGLKALGANPGEARWLLVLCGASVDEKFTFVFPELREAFDAHVTGVADNSQFLVLLSHALQEPLRRLGASGPATSAALGVASGSGPQQLEEIYASTFHLYPWQSMDPRTGVPVDGRHRWQALSGWGTHSLPQDFQPSSIELLDGRRVVAVVGPRQSRRLGTRVIGVHRMFNTLRAEITHVRPLGHDGFEQVLNRVRLAAT